MIQPMGFDIYSYYSYSYLRVIHGTNVRMVLDFGDLDRTAFCNIP